MKKEITLLAILFYSLMLNIAEAQIVTPICFSAPTNTMTILLPHSIGFGGNTVYPANAAITADFNKDGLADLVTINTDEGTKFYQYLNQGSSNGYFINQSDYSGSSNSYSVATGIISADFNGDSLLDVAISTYLYPVTYTSTGVVQIALNQGAPNYQLLPTSTFTTHAKNNALTSCDFNGDNKMDIGVASIDYYDKGYVEISLGDGAGNFGTTTSFTLANNYMPAYNSGSITNGDFNGDNKKDIAVAVQNQSTGDSAISVLIGDGSGGFATPTNYSVAGIFSIISNDFNGDGKSDIATVNPNYNTISVLVSNGSGFSTATNYAAGSYPSKIIEGDFNSDGKIDLITQNDNSKDVSVFLGYGNGTFTTSANFLYGGTYPTYFLTGGDYNGDGKADIIAGQSKSGSGGGGKVDISILFNAVPISISGANTICSGGTTTLTATGATSYTWSPLSGLNTANSATVIASPTVTTTYTITGSGTNTCVNATIDSVVVSVCTDISTILNENRVNIYPNPNTGTFIIETNSTEKQTLQIFDINGRLVLSQYIHDKISVDASKLNEGIYNVSIPNSTGVINRRMVIVR